MANDNRGLWLALAVLVVVLLAGPALAGGVMGPGMVGPGMMGGYGAGSVGGGSWGLAVGLGWLSMLAFWGALIVGVVLLVRWLGGSTGAGGRGGGESALEILKRRYAAGEITKEQYEEMRQTLGR
jgi:putative membrane protein